MLRSRSLSVVVLAAASLAASGDALAQGSEAQKTAAAQALYDRATAEMDKKDYAHACPELEEVVKLIPEGVGAKVTLAECYEAADKLASAWTSYMLAETAAAKAGMADRQKKAHDRAVAIKPRLAQLTIVVPDAVKSLPGLEIKRDGIPVGSAQFGVPLPVDKGTHTVIAIVTGKPRLERTIEVKADATEESFTVDWPPASAPVVAPPLPTVDTSAPIVEPPPPPPPASTGWSTQRKIGLGVGLGGVGILAIGSAFGIVAINKKSESNDGHCTPDNVCDDTGLQLRDSGRTAGTLSTVFFVLGGAAIAGGITLFVTAPSPSSDAAQARAIKRLEVAALPGALAVRAKF